mgnify:CR=1 FL=1
MANSKVQLANGTVLIDLTSDTVDAAHLIQGYTAHDKAGNKITGTASGGISVSPLNVSANGTYTAPSGQAYSPVTVNVPTPSPRLQSKTATANGTVSPDAGYDGLSSVTVAIPTYDGSVS